MRRKHPMLIAIFLVLSCLGESGRAQQVASMKLMAPNVGWAKSGEHLFWTTDNGVHWKNITPRMSSKEIIGGVFFLNVTAGWVLLNHSDTNHLLQFRVASTRDSGGDWTFSKQIGAGKRIADDFGGGGELYFLDPLHGWLNLDILSSSSFAPARLLETEDGGSTWKISSGDPGRQGYFCFFGTSDGLLAGGPQATEVYVTHDGSNSWQPLTLKAPIEVAPDIFPTYGKPVCQANRGFLPVTFSGPDGSQSSLVLFGTEDSGKSWRPTRTLSRLDEKPPGQTVSATIVGSDLLAFSSVGSKPALAALPSNGAKVFKTEPDSLKNVRDMSFIDVSHGWVLTAAGISSTSDGGSSWTDITPSRSGSSALPKAANPTSVPHSKVPLASINGLGVSAVSNIHTGPWQDIHLGFDTGSVPSSSQMQTWWTYSPYYDYQISLAGAANHKNNPLLTPSWVQAVENDGWGLWPVWVGPQAPCVNQSNLVLISDSLNKYVSAPWNVAPEEIAGR